MITAIHTLIYSDDAEVTRKFLVDVLQWPHIDTGGGWLIFKTGPSELGVHPTSSGDWSTERKHEISFVCDDIDATVAELTERGATFSTGIIDEDFGRTIQLEVPGGANDILLLEPRYDPPATSL